MVLSIGVPKVCDLRAIDGAVAKAHVGQRPCQAADGLLTEHRRIRRGREPGVVREVNDKSVFHAEDTHVVLELVHAVVSIAADGLDGLQLDDRARTVRQLE